MTIMKAVCGGCGKRLQFKTRRRAVFCDKCKTTTKVPEEHSIQARFTVRTSKLALEARRPVDTSTPFEVPAAFALWLTGCLEARGFLHAAQRRDKGLAEPYHHPVLQIGCDRWRDPAFLYRIRDTLGVGSVTPCRTGNYRFQLAGWAAVSRLQATLRPYLTPTGLALFERLWSQFDNPEDARNV